MPLPPHVVVFSDVDGVLLHRSDRSVARARAAFRNLAAESVPVVLCSLKTRAELEIVQQEFGIREPFIAEAGSALFIPDGYFLEPAQGARQIAGYDAIEFGRPYDEVVRKLREAAGRVQVPLSSFSEMSVDEVARDCGLSPLEARLAKLRDYVELFTYADGTPAARDRLARALEASRLRCMTRGPFEVVGSVLHPGTAVAVLRALFSRAFGRVMTVGMADGFAFEGHLSSMDAKVIVHDDPGVSGAIDAGDWAEGIVEAVEEVRTRARAVGRRVRAAALALWR